MILFGVANSETVLAESREVSIAFVSPMAESEFNTQVKPFFERSKSCTLCSLVFVQKPKEEIWQSLLELPKKFSVIYVPYNEALKESDRNLPEKIQKVLRENSSLLVGFAGLPLESQNSGPLKRTFLGQIPQALIVGELTERERLLPRMYYGPEMITAIKPKDPSSFPGASGLVFVSQLARNLHLRSSEEWPEYLRNRRAKNKKLWPEIADFF